MSKQEKNLEARARRAAHAVGLIACKSRQRTNVPNIDNLGGFALIDPKYNAFIAGSRYELSADDVLDRVAKIRGA